MLLTEQPMYRADAWRMIQHRASNRCTRMKIGCHTFSATGIATYLEAGGTLENPEAMAVLESPPTTKPYDPPGDEITLSEVERVTIHGWSRAITAIARVWSRCCCAI